MYLNIFSCIFFFYKFVKQAETSKNNDKELTFIEDVGDIFLSHLFLSVISDKHSSGTV